MDVYLEPCIDELFKIMGRHQGVLHLQPNRSKAISIPWNTCIVNHDVSRLIHFCGMYYQEIYPSYNYH